MFYAKSTNGFYNREIHGGAIPADAVEITHDEWTALLDGQSKGKVISADASGLPVLTDPPPAPAPRAKTPEQKLKDAGLSVDELKTLLGIS